MQRPTHTIRNGGHAFPSPPSAQSCVHLPCHPPQVHARAGFWISPDMRAPARPLIHLFSRAPKPMHEQVQRVQQSGGDPHHARLRRPLTEGAYICKHLLVNSPRSMTGPHWSPGTHSPNSVCHVSKEPYMQLKETYHYWSPRLCTAPDKSRSLSVALSLAICDLSSPPLHSYPSMQRAGH